MAARNKFQAGDVVAQRRSEASRREIPKDREQFYAKVCKPNHYTGIRAALANAEVRSPFAGTITNLDLKVGEFAASGTPVITLADLSSWIVKTTDLTEIDVVNVQQGQPVTLSLDAMQDASLSGQVLSIAQNYSEKQGDIVYEVKVLLTDRNPAMRWGMTAQVNFQK